MWYQEHSPLNGLKCFDNGFRHKKIHFWSNTEQSVWSLSCVQLFSTPRTAARQVSLSVTNSQNLLRLMAIKLVMPSNHLILCRLLLLLPSIFPSIRVFSSESVLRIRWPKQLLMKPKIDAFKLWCCRRLLRVPWTARIVEEGVRLPNWEHPEFLTHRNDYLYFKPLNIGVIGYTAEITRIDSDFKELKNELESQEVREPSQVY